MGIAVEVQSTDTRQSVQVPVGPGQTIVNTGSYPIRLCTDDNFGMSKTYVITPGAAIPWDGPTCFAVLQTTVNAQPNAVYGYLWVTDNLFYASSAATNTQQFMAASNVKLANGGQFILRITDLAQFIPPNTLPQPNQQSYPQGTGPLNYHSVVIAMNGLGTNQRVSGYIVDANGQQLHEQTTIYSGAFAQIMFPLQFGQLANGTNGAPEIIINNGTPNTITFDIIFDQEPSVVAAVIAGVELGVTIPTTDLADGLIGSPVPTTGILTAGVDGAGNLRAEGISVNGAQAPPNVQQVGGTDFSTGNVRPLPIPAVGNATPTYLLIVGGDDGTNSRIMPVALIGSAGVGRIVQVGGTDGGGLGRSIPIPLGGGTATGYGVQVSGADTGGTAHTIPVVNNGAAEGSQGLVVSGADGTNARILPLAVPNNAPPNWNNVVGGIDPGGLGRTLFVDTTGRQIVVGAAASGGVLAGNPVLIAGSDTTDARSILTDTSGRLIHIPRTSVAESNNSLATTGGSAQFGPTTAVQAVSWTISCVAANSTGGVNAIIRVTIRLGSATGTIIAELLMAQPVMTVANGQNLSGYFGEGGLAAAATSGGDFWLVWAYSGGPFTTINGQVSATVSYT